MNARRIATLLALTLGLAGAALVKAAPDEKPGAPSAPTTPEPPPSGGGSTNRGEALPGGAPEIGGYKDRVVFILDRSGSMALADRFALAIDIIDQLLQGMPKDSKFDVYLVTESAASLFKGEWYKPTGDMRKQLRSRIQEMGGLDFGGYTDFATPIDAACEKRRPDAVYVLTDGVSTVRELDTPDVIAKATKAAKAHGIPVHTIALGVGQDVAEDAGEAVAVLKGISEATNGVFREVRCDLRPKPRAYTQHPAWAPPLPEDLVVLNLKGPDGRKLWKRQFGGKGLAEVVVEVEDPALTKGSIAFEYADMKVLIRSYLSNGRLFDESRPLPVKRQGDRLLVQWSVKIVSAMDDTDPDEPSSGGVLSVKAPSGGSVDFVYRRGSREWKETCILGAVQEPQGGGGGR